MVFVVLIGIIVVSWGWNFYQATIARNGLTFELRYRPEDVSAAASRAFLGSKMGARVKSFVRGVDVRSGGPSQFVYGTKYGDEGLFSIAPSAGGSTVRVQTNRLFVGWNRNPNARSGFYQLVFGLTSLFMKIIYFRPNAPKMRRFQSNLQRRLEKELSRTS